VVFSTQSVSYGGKLVGGRDKPLLKTLSGKEESPALAENHESDPNRGGGEPKENTLETKNS